MYDVPRYQTRCSHRNGDAVKVRCPSCEAINEVSLPVLLGVCICGVLIRARVEGQTTNVPDTPSAPLIDHYAVLGVSKLATDAEIKSAYRRRVKETHPDVGGDQDEFRLVQAAYETIGDPTRRRQYDTADSEPTIGNITAVVPDLIGSSVVDAVKTGSNQGFIVRVAIVEVPHQSPLSGRVIGQYPYPNSQITEPVIGLLVAVQTSSTIWQRLKVIALDFATGFWGGLKNSAAGSGLGQRSIGSGSGVQQAGESAGEVVGNVAITAVETAVTAIGCLFKIYIFFGWLMLIGFTVVMLSVAPPIGIASLLLVVYLFYRKVSKGSS